MLAHLDDAPTTHFGYLETKLVPVKPSIDVLLPSTCSPPVRCAFRRKCGVVPSVATQTGVDRASSRGVRCVPGLRHYQILQGAGEGRYVTTDRSVRQSDSRLVNEFVGRLLRLPGIRWVSLVVLCDRSLARSLCGRSVGRSVDRSVCQTVNHSVSRSVGRSIG